MLGSDVYALMSVEEEGVRSKCYDLSCLVISCSECLRDDYYIKKITVDNRHFFSFEPSYQQQTVDNRQYTVIRKRVGGRL